MFNEGQLNSILLETKVLSQTELDRDAAEAKKRNLPLEVECDLRARRQKVCLPYCHERSASLRYLPLPALRQRH